MLLPAPQLRCRMPPEQSRYAARHAGITLSKALPRSLRPRQVASHCLRRRPAYRSRRQPDRQIAIGGYPTIPRGFLPWRLSDAGPQSRLINCEWAGIRNPSQFAGRAEADSAGRYWSVLKLVGLDTARDALAPSPYI
jgi:hypothetical protein